MNFMSDEQWERLHANKATNEPKDWELTKEYLKQHEPCEIISVIPDELEITKPEPGAPKPKELVDAMERLDKAVDDTTRILQGDTSKPVQPRKSWWRRWMDYRRENEVGFLADIAWAGTIFLIVAGGIMMLCMGISVLIRG